MLDQNRVIAIWAGGDHVNGHTRYVLNALQIQARIDGQLVKLRHTHRTVCPTFNGLVNGCATCNVVSAHGQNVDHFTIKLVAGTKFQFFQTV